AGRPGKNLNAQLARLNQEPGLEIEIRVMYISNKHLPRRAVLKGLGVTIALPFLDAMVPAGTAWAREAAAGKNRVRFVAMEMVHGAAGSTNFGAKRNLWSPADVGSAFDLSPTSLASLEPYREYLTIVSNTD